MYSYTIIQWLFFFYLYCFFGWVFESSYVSLKSRKFVNRGFMRGPFLPIYGSGAIMMLVVSMPFQKNVVLTYLAGCVGATVLEFVTGVCMESLFKVRYWDYSKQKFNYKGHICLSSTVAWGFLTILMTEFLHVGVERIVFQIPVRILTILTVVLTVAIASDFTLAFKAAMELRDILIGMDRAKKELERIQKRMDVIIAVMGNEFETRTQESLERAETIVNNLEESFRKAKDKLMVNPTALAEDMREEITELRSRFLVEREHRLQFTRLKDLYQRSILKGNPGMYSAKFGEALEELKKAADMHRKNGKGY